MLGFETKFQRLELKYMIDEATAARVRRDLAPYCRPDRHNQIDRDAGAISAASGYPVHTLYLDSPNLAFHHAKARGEPERMKLRIRGYRGARFAVLEIKRRHADLIDKTRTRVATGEIEAAARGFAKPLDDSEQARRFLEGFAGNVAAAGAAPTLLVRYQREAYASRSDAYARVTFDRDVAVQRTRRWEPYGEPDRWVEFAHHYSPTTPRPCVILELKCERRVPLWIAEIIQRHELRRQTVSKYSLGILVTQRLNGSTVRPRRCAEAFL